MSDTSIWWQVEDGLRRETENERNKEEVEIQGHSGGPSRIGNASRGDYDGTWSGTLPFVGAAVGRAQRREEDVEKEAVFMFYLGD